MNKRIYRRVERLIISLILISLTFPFLFSKSETVHYKALGMTKTYTHPNMEMFWFPVGLIILFTLMQIWEPEWDM
jgi:hypothetical protein